MYGPTGHSCLVHACLDVGQCKRVLVFPPISDMCPGGQALGDRVLRPFLQDTVRWWPLTVTMAGTLLAAPLTIARVLAQARDTEHSAFSTCSPDLRIIWLAVTVLLQPSSTAVCVSCLPAPALLGRHRLLAECVQVWVHLMSA